MVSGSWSGARCDVVVGVARTTRLVFLVARKIGTFTYNKFKKDEEDFWYRWSFVGDYGHVFGLRRCGDCG